MSLQSKKITNKYFPNPEIDIKTPAFQKKKGFTNYDEMMAYLTSYSEKFPNICSIDFLGESQKGKAIPRVRLSGKTRNRKVKVWIQGGFMEMSLQAQKVFLFDGQNLNR